jgi:hypothetical protein
VDFPAAKIMAVVIMLLSHNIFCISCPNRMGKDRFYQQWPDAELEMETELACWARQSLLPS